MRDALLLVDIFNDFAHKDGGQLLRSFRDRVRRLHELVHGSRERGIPLIYANDSKGIFDGDSHALVTRARRGPAGACLDEISPLAGDRFVIKPRYSAFDSTPLELILRSLQIERVLVAGMATEHCVTQTAIAARQSGFEVVVVASACATADAELETIALNYLERVAGVRLRTPADLFAPGHPLALARRSDAAG